MLKWQLRVERARASLFFVPTVFVASAIVMAGVMIEIDGRVSQAAVRLPPFLYTTPDNARSLLSTVASATITVAGVVFAITLVSIQLAASQFSPRVIPGFLRDSRQQRVMGLAVGTFTYALVVLRAVRGSSEPGLLFVPHLSSALSLGLAIVTIVALVGFLDRSARTMQVGHIVFQLTEETRRRIRALYPYLTGERPSATTPPPVPAAGAPSPVRAVASGWVCHLDLAALLAAAPPSGVLRLDIRNGSFVAAGQTIGAVWPAPADPEAFGQTIGQAIVLGDSRMLLSDVAFGIRQLVDIGLRALSPGIHDPTTAYDVIVHLAVIVRELLWRDLAPVAHAADDRHVIFTNDLTHVDYVNRAFDQIRQAGATQSAIVATLMDTLGTMARDLERDGLGERAGSVRRQGRLALAGYEASAPLQDDLVRVHALADRHGLREAS